MVHVCVVCVYVCVERTGEREREKEKEREREREGGRERERERERERKREREGGRGRGRERMSNDHDCTYIQAKFMPHAGDSVLVTAARDGQIRCHVLSTSGNLMTSKRVSHHRDSAHKVR